MSRQKQYQIQARMAEHVAAMLLVLKGYRLVGLNRHLQGVEVDVLTQHKNFWVVGEVKVRRRPEATWENAISPTQRARLERVATHLSQRHKAPARVDLILFQPRPPFIKHYRDI